MKTILILLFMAVASSASSQKYFYLEEIKLRKKDDFKANEGNVIKATDYLLNTPIDEGNHDRKACMRFIIRYAEKISNITITIDGAISKLSDGNGDLLIVYMGVWLKTSFVKPDADWNYQQKEILTAIYKYVKSGNNVKSNSAIKKLIEAGDENKIDQFIKSYEPNK
ncbi:MAG TPA: hypothetical protein VK174_06670 [Chitinophagales bacterium]|nr:hypothetical protein [Chitinophagales bacterium]